MLGCFACAREVTPGRRTTRQPAALPAHLQIPEWDARCKAGRWQHLRFAFSQSECQGLSAPPHPPTAKHLQECLVRLLGGGFLVLPDCRANLTGIPISWGAGAAGGRLPRSTDVFLSFFPSPACHGCQSNGDQLRLTPVLRLVNSLLLSGWVTDGTSTTGLLRVVLVAASHHCRVCRFQFTWAEQTQFSCTPASQGLSQDGRGAP